MEPNDQRTLQILITTGLEDADRAALGLNAALVAQSGGIKTFVFFTLRGTYWACKSPRKDLPRADVLAIISQLIELGAQLSCCMKCLDQHCHMASEEESIGLLQKSIRPAGLASVTLRAASGTPSLTF